MLDIDDTIITESWKHPADYREKFILHSPFVEVAFDGWVGFMAPVALDDFEPIFRSNRQRVPEWFHPGRIVLYGDAKLRVDALKGSWGLLSRIDPKRDDEKKDCWGLLNGARLPPQVRPLTEDRFERVLLVDLV